MSSPGVLSIVPYAGVHPPPDPCGWWYLAWVWVEGRKETAPPAMVWSPSTRRQASSRIACLCRRSISLFGSCGAHLSVCPPSPFPHTTVRVPIPSLLTEDYFRGRSARLCPAGPGHPVGCFDVSGPRPCSPPPLPPYSMAIISGSRSSLMGQVALLGGLWVTPRHGRGPRARLPRLQRAGPKYLVCL